MDEGPKTNEESWTVEPSKKVASKKRKALRIAQGTQRAQSDWKNK